LGNDGNDDVDSSSIGTQSRVAGGDAAKRNVRFWHKADIATRSTNVRFWG
jgi:hypothetical protein